MSAVSEVGPGGVPPSVGVHNLADLVYHAASTSRTDADDVTAASGTGQPRTADVDLGRQIPPRAGAAQGGWRIDQQS